MRNSSLVERDCAENVTGLKLGTETRDLSSDKWSESVPPAVKAYRQGVLERAGVRMLA